jgi:hypothetical protein
MKYAVEMDSGAMMYIPCFIRTRSGIQKLIWEDSQTHRQHGDRVRILLNNPDFPCVRDFDTHSSQAITQKHCTNSMELSNP